jgi:hypothetical protein
MISSLGNKNLKYSFLVVFFLIICVWGIRANAQDLIVSTKGDSINCTVMVQNLKSVHFFYKDGTSVVTRELPRTAVKSVIVGYYKLGKKDIPTEKELLTPIAPEVTIVEAPAAAVPIVDSTAIEEANTPVFSPTPDAVVRDSLTEEYTESRLLDTVLIVTKARHYSRWFLGFRGGYSNRLVRTNQAASPSVKEYFDELRSGYALGIGTGYFFWKSIALGINAEMYQSRASMLDDTRDDKVNIGFVGVSATHRRVLRYDKSATYASFLLGYQSYLNERHEVGELEIFRGKAVGWGLSLGIDYAISPHVALSFTASCLSGSLYNLSRQANGKTDQVKLNPNDIEDLSRIALTIGLRFL